MTTEQQLDPVGVIFKGYQDALNAERNHVQVAHAKILKQREQLNVLNGVIARRKRTMRQLREYVEAVRLLHRRWVIDGDTDDPLIVCKECCCDPDGNQSEQCADNHTDACWPCRTTIACTYSLKRTANDH